MCEWLFRTLKMDGSELRMVEIKWISMEIDGCAAMRKWCMLHLASRGNFLAHNGLLVKFIYHNEIYWLVRWVLSKHFGAYRLRHSSSTCCALLWPPRLCSTKKMNDENDKTKEIEKKRGAHIRSLCAYICSNSIQNVDKSV